MNREDMIRMLVDSSLAAAAEDPQAGWLREIFTRGFRGFETRSTPDLVRELQFRGIAEFEDSAGTDDWESDDGEIPDENVFGLNRSRSSAEAERE
jgi:hypothetical protein